MSDTIQFLDKVKISKVLVRRFGKRTPNGNRHCKFWDEKDIKAKTAHFLGFRTLSNGVNEYDSDYGIIYGATDYVSAALVVFDERSKPVYVAIKELKRVYS